MPSPPKFSAPQFGAWLVEQRGNRTLEQIALRVRNLVKAYGLKVNRSAIQKYEQGRIPPWPVLNAFAEIYGEHPDAIAARLFRSVQAGEDGDLLCHGGDQRSGSSKGDSPDARSAVERRPVSELEERVKALETALGKVSDVALQLVDIAVAGGKVDRATSQTTRSRRGRRKTA